MFDQNVAQLLRDIAIIFPALLIVFTFRGFFRALVTRWQGDLTAYHDGYLSLNPLAHVDIAGVLIILSVVFIVGSLLGGGHVQDMLYALMIIIGIRWTYEVPFESRNFNNLKRGVIFTHLSRSIGCFLLSLIFMYIAAYCPFRLLPPAAVKTLIALFMQTIRIAIWFGVISLIPIPPFDGGKLLQFVLPYSKQETLAWLEEYSLIVILCIFFLPIVSDICLGIINMIASYIQFGLAHLVIVF